MVVDGENVIDIMMMYGLWDYNELQYLGITRENLQEL